MTATPTAATIATLRDAALGLADADTFTGFAAPALTGQLGLRVGRAQELIEQAQAELAAVLRTLDADD
ncbi:hypothetical protein ABQE69_05395 [Mycolicibacillus trivialis]|uniref:hypothetical protein n=1 Tax=Mycolicibacter arupensis TaxID=342002 RepID=UPI00061B4AAA|nr:MULTISPECIES: hypothetical protein [Mycobacteriaceae]KAA1430453.1 hypothetical protein F0402_14045 [Mycolicibacter arupensis]